MLSARLLLLPLLLVSAGGCRHGAPPDPQALSFHYRWGDPPGGVEGLSGWAAESAAWHELEPARLLEHRADRSTKLWLRADLPARRPERPALLLPAFRYAAEVRLGDGTLLEPSRPALESLRLGGGAPRVVRLPEAALDQPLLVRVFSPTDKIGPLDAASLGDERDLIAQRVASSLPSLIAGCALGALGVVAALAGLTASSRRLALLFGAWSASMGLYVLSHGRAYDLIGIEAPLGFGLWALATALAPPTAVRFMRELVPGLGGARTEALAWWGGALFGAGTLASLLYTGSRFWPAGAGAVAVFSFLWPAHRVVVAWCLLWAGARLRERALRRDRVALVLVAGAAPFAAALAVDIAAALGWYLPGWRSQVHWAALALVLAAAVALQWRYAEASEARERYTKLLAERVRERELLMQDLHDGVGALTTNVRMLAEIGQRQGLDAAHATLGIIGGLASDSVAELRGVITGLDPELTWSGLSAHLRELARRLLEGRSIELRFQQRLSAVDEHPPAVVATNLLAIYREALTNALRHAAPDYLSVELIVERDLARLRVENDGGQAPDGATANADSGRGLRGMRRRARELGGTLRVNLGPVTEIDVVILLAPPQLG